MGRLFFVDYDEYPKEDFIHCVVCRTRIGLVHEFITGIENGSTVLAAFDKVFNVQVDAEKYHRQVNGNTVADNYCVKCGMLLGMKVIVVPYSHRNVDIKEGRFLMSINELVFWNNELLFVDTDEEDDEQDPDDEGGVNEDDEQYPDQD